MSWKKLEFNNNSSELKQFKFEEVDDCIQGEFILFKENGRYKSNYFIILENNNGRWIINCSADLQRQFLQYTEKEMINEHDTVLIRYTGNKHIPGKPKSMKMFSVFIKE